MSERWPDKVIVGLTGNIATGKSTILRLAEEMGALALDADDAVHEILAADPGAQQAIVDAFGPGVRLADGAIDRAAVANIVFNDQQALDLLEQILHPRVRHRLLERIDRSPAAVVFIEAIKLLEGGLAAVCDQIWVTRCSAQTQVQRLMNYRELDERTALMRVNAQSSQEMKAAAADVIIDTDGTLDETKAYFQLAWNRLQRRRLNNASLTEGLPKTAMLEPGARDNLASDQDGDSLPGNEPATIRTYRPTAARNTELFGQGIVVRRAHPTDIPAIIRVIEQASLGAVKPERDSLMRDFGERGYLIGQQDDEISAIAGWNADNLVATIDCIYVHPPDAIPVTGAAVFQEIEVTANELTCEVILALPDENGPPEIRRLLAEQGFSYVVPATLPRVWREAVADALPRSTTVMMKVLRDTREVHVRTIEEHNG